MANVESKYEANGMIGKSSKFLNMLSQSSNEEQSNQANFSPIGN